VNERSPGRGGPGPVRGLGGALLVVLLAAGVACSSGGRPHPKPPASPVDTSFPGFQVRPVLASSIGVTGSLAGVPFTTGVLAPEDPYRNDPRFAELPADSKGDLVTFADANGDGYYSPAADTKYRLGPPVVTSGEVRSATAALGTPSGRWAVNVALDPAGTRALSSATRGLFGEQLAMLVDGQVVSAPFVQQPITTGNLQVDGGLTEAVAKSLASQLNPAA
jgi:hypothetical protein